MADFVLEKCSCLETVGIKLSGRGGGGLWSAVTMTTSEKKE